MDDASVAIIIVLMIVVLLVLIALPIAAFIISLVTRRKLRQQLAAFQTSQALTPDTLQQLRASDLAPLARAIQQVEARTERLEAALKAHSIAVPDETVTSETPAPEPALPTPAPAPPQRGTAP